MLFQPLIIRQNHWVQMESHARQSYPIEACGLMAGVNARIEMVLPVKNTLNSRERFRMDAQEQLEFFLQIEKQHWDLLGIYHSHPNGPLYPSKTDIEEAYYPEAAYLIWSINDGKWSCCAFHIMNGEVTPIELIIE